MPVIDRDSPSVLKSIDILQSLIGRMADRSAAAKNWCVTVASASMVFAANNANPSFAILALLPLLLFMSLDTYYLTLERQIRRQLAKLVTSIREDSVSHRDLYEVGVAKLQFRETVRSLRSTSIWPFYLLVVLTLFATYKFVR